MKLYLKLRILLLIGLLILMGGCATNKSGVIQPVPQATSSGAKSSVIQKISFAEEANYTKILIQGSEPMALPFYKLMPDPLRIVIDIPNVDLKQIREPLKIDNGTIRDVIASQYDGRGRIEIVLTQTTNYNISKDDKILTVDVEKVRIVVEGKEDKKEEVSVKLVEPLLVEVKKEEFF